MSDPTPTTPSKRPRRAARGRGALGPGSDPGQLRLRVTRRTEPDVRKLVEWVLNITQARYDAHLAGEPDPYDLPPPDALTIGGLDRVSDARGRMEPEPSHEPLNERSTA